MNISAYIVIKNRTISLNGVEIYSEKETLPSEFLINAYRYFKIDYPKFFKMDNLSKLAILSTELLFRQQPGFLESENFKTGVLIANSSSSLNVDEKFQTSMKSIASPSFFVYTLPNVMVGEICIKYKIFGENYVIITDGFQTEQFVEFVKSINLQNEMEKLIAGYCNFDDIDAISSLFLIENQCGIYSFNNENVTKMFKSV